jgi:hypothetical protein
MVWHHVSQVTTWAPELIQCTLAVHAIQLLRSLNLLQLLAASVLIITSSNRIKFAPWLFGSIFSCLKPSYGTMMHKSFFLPILCIYVRQNSLYYRLALIVEIETSNKGRHVTKPHCDTFEQFLLTQCVVCKMTVFVVTPLISSQNTW